VVSGYSDLDKVTKCTFAYRFFSGLLTYTHSCTFHFELELIFLEHFFFLDYFLLFFFGLLFIYYLFILLFKNGFIVFFFFFFFLLLVFYKNKR